MKKKKEQTERVIYILKECCLWVVFFFQTKHYDGRHEGEPFFKTRQAPNVTISQFLKICTGHYRCTAKKGT